DPVQGCNDATPQPTSFCIKYDANVTKNGIETPTPAEAGDVGDFNWSLVNSSGNEPTDKNLWLDHMVLTLLGEPDPAAITPSSVLDNNLLIAGSNTDCGSSGKFTTCTAGQGTIDGDVSGSDDPSVSDGINSGSFGIVKVVNVNPPQSGTVIDWKVTADFCIDASLLGCNSGSGPVQHTFEVTAPTANPTHLTIPAQVQFSYPAFFPQNGDVTVDASIKSVDRATFLGQSGKVDAAGDPAAPGGSQTIIQLPKACGNADASATAVDRHADTATAPLTFQVSGCPTALFTAKETKPYNARFDGNASTAAPDRNVAKWHWSFGDGATATTFGPTVSHTYAASKARTVTLVVEDDSGVLSQPKRLSLRGSKLTLRAPRTAVSRATVTLTGALTRSGSRTGLTHRKLLLQRCRANGSHCKKVAVVLTGRKGAWHAKTKFLTNRPMFRATFAGGGGYVGVVASRTVGHS
ncbi:MAG: PKD domain-containing protein, partial [Frankiales bacterium]|nr:PKD domain-containing protein [Frankiales bacterium]